MAFRSAKVAQVDRYFRGAKGDRRPSPTETPYGCRKSPIGMEPLVLKRRDTNVLQFDAFRAEDHLLDAQVGTIRNHRALSGDFSINEGTADLLAAFNNHPKGKRLINPQQIRDRVVFRPVRCPTLSALRFPWQ